MITIRVVDKQVLDMLGELSRRMTNLQPAMQEIGEDIVASTKRRFADSVGPDGTPWAVNSPVTVARYLGVKGRAYKKDGTLSKRGAALSGAKKPLIGESKILGHDINLQLIGTNAVSVGSSREYAAMQQFGGTKAQFPHLWGNIPARPFLGVSDLNKANILDILGSYLVP